MVAPNEWSPPIARTGIFEPARGKHCAIVDGVLIERRELQKSCMHAARCRVEPCIVLARSFREVRRVRRKFVPEAVEVDTFPAGDEAFHIRATKPEMPQQRILQHLFPRSDARHRRIHHHQPRGAFGMRGGKGERHHVSDVVTDDVRLRDVQRVQHTGDILRLVPLGEAVCGNR